MKSQVGERRVSNVHQTMSMLGPASKGLGNSFSQLAGSKPIINPKALERAKKRDEDRSNASKSDWKSELSKISQRSGILNKFKKKGKGDKDRYGAELGGLTNQELLNKDLDASRDENRENWQDGQKSATLPRETHLSGLDRMKNRKDNIS